MKCSKRSFTIVSALFAVLLSSSTGHSMRATPTSPLAPSRRLRPHRQAVWEEVLAPVCVKPGENRIGIQAPSWRDWFSKPRSAKFSENVSPPQRRTR